MAPCFPTVKSEAERALQELLQIRDRKTYVDLIIYDDQATSALGSLKELTPAVKVQITDFLETLRDGGGSLCDRSPFPLPVIGMLDLDVCAMHMERALRVVKIHVAHAPARDQGGGKARAPSIHIERMAHAFHLCILRSASSISCSIFYCDMPWLHQPFWHALLPTR